MSLKGYFLEKVVEVGVNYFMEYRLNLRDTAERRNRLERVLKHMRMPRNCHVEKLTISGRYAEWLSFPNSKRDKVILYLHGGGYAYCSVNTHRALAAGIGKASGAMVLIPEYRLAPEHPFPAAIDDAIDTYRWLLQQGYLADNIIFAGDSAGGGLSVAASIALRDRNEPLPAAIVCLSPWVDLTSSGDSYRRNRRIDPYLNVEAVRMTSRQYAGGEPLDHPLISPVFADLSGLPPMMIQVGSHEILQSDAELLAKRAREAGVAVKFQKWKGMWHVWQIFGDSLPEAKVAIREIGKFAKQSLQK